MHIEEGVVQGAKFMFSYGTGAAVLAYGAKTLFDEFRRSGGMSVIARCALATLLVFGFFEMLPKYPVGVSEVHFILGSTLFLLFGTGPAAVGLAGGLLIQGVFFAPFDLPQYWINVTTLLAPLFAISWVAQRTIDAGTAYQDLSYKQVFQLSVTYQGGVVAWVIFWALYGQGFGAENLANVASFGAAYMLVVIVEPFVDLGVLYLAKTAKALESAGLVQRRVYQS